MSSFDLDSVASENSAKLNRIDPNIITLKKKGLKRFKNGETKEITVEYNVYGTGLCGRIRDAVSGQYMDHKVGSSDEHLYFKMIMTSGPRPITLFYKSPAEYELHQQRELLDDHKDAWRYKRGRYTSETAF